MVDTCASQRSNASITKWKIFLRSNSIWPVKIWMNVGQHLIATITFFPGAQRPPRYYVSMLHKHTHAHAHTRTHSREAFSEWVTSTAHNKHKTIIHFPSGIRIHDPSNRAAVDIRLRPHGHQGRLIVLTYSINNKVCLITQYSGTFILCAWKCRFCIWFQISQFRNSVQFFLKQWVFNALLAATFMDLVCVYIYVYIYIITQ